MRSRNEQDELVNKRTFAGTNLRLQPSSYILRVLLPTGGVDLAAVELLVEDLLGVLFGF